jgi:hypothetical protein
MPHSILPYQLKAIERQSESLRKVRVAVVLLKIYQKLAYENLYWMGNIGNPA